MRIVGKLRTAGWFSLLFNNFHRTPPFNLLWTYTPFFSVFCSFFKFTQKYCESEGGRLAEPRSQPENSFLISQMRHWMSTESWWLGARRRSLTVDVRRRGDSSDLRRRSSTVGAAADAASRRRGESSIEAALGGRLGRRRVENREFTSTGRSASTLTGGRSTSSNKRSEMWRWESDGEMIDFDSQPISRQVSVNLSSAEMECMWVVEHVDMACKVRAWRMVLD